MQKHQGRACLVPGKGRSLSPRRECTDQAPQKRKGRPFPVSQAWLGNSSASPHRPPLLADHAVHPSSTSGCAQDCPTPNSDPHRAGLDEDGGGVLVHALLSPPLSLPALVRRNSIHWRRAEAAPSIHACGRGRWELGRRRARRGRAAGLSHSTVVRACLCPGSPRTILKS